MWIVRFDDELGSSVQSAYSIQCTNCTMYWRSWPTGIMPISALEYPFFGQWGGLMALRMRAVWKLKAVVKHFLDPWNVAIMLTNRIYCE